MPWYRVINKATQERQHICCEADQVDVQYPRTEYFKPRELESEPGECDEFDLTAGKMKHSDAKRKRVDEEARWNRMSRAEMAEAIIQEVMRRMDERQSTAAAKVNVGAKLS